MAKIYRSTRYFIYLAGKYNWSKYLKQLQSEPFINKCQITLTHFATKNMLLSAAFPQKEQNASSQKRRRSVLSSAVYSSCFGTFENKPHSQQRSPHWESGHSSSQRARTRGQQPAGPARLDRATRMGGSSGGQCPPGLQ